MSEPRLVGEYVKAALAACGINQNEGNEVSMENDISIIYDKNLVPRRYVFIDAMPYEIHWTVREGTEAHDLHGCKTCGYAYQAHQFMNDGSSDKDKCAFCAAKGGAS